MNVFDLSAKIALDINGFLSGMNTAQSVAISTMSVIGSQVSGFINSSVEVGKGFSSSMSQVAATMGNTMDEMGAEVGSVDTQFGHFDGTMRDFAKFMGKNTAFSARQASDALNYMALAGYDTQKSMETLPNVLNLAAAGNMDLAKASDMVTDAQTALGLTQERTTQMMNEMAKAASSGNTNVAQLGDAFLTVGGLAKNLNGGMVTLADGTQQEIDGVTELEIALTAMANAGIKGSEAGTHMRNMLLKLSSPTDEGAKRMEELGVKVFDAQGNMRSLKDVMGDLNIALGRVTQEEKLQAISDLFNARDIASAEALLAAVGQDWDYLGEQILNADGAMEQMAETQLDNLQGDITKMNSAMEGLQIAISDAATPAMRELTQFSTKMIGDITDAFSKLPEPLQTSIAMIGMAGGKVAEFAPQAFGMINALKQSAELAKLNGDATGGLAGKVLGLGPAFAIAAAAIGGAIAILAIFQHDLDANTKAVQEFVEETDKYYGETMSAVEGVERLGKSNLTAADATMQHAQAQEYLAQLQDAQANAAKRAAEAQEKFREDISKPVEMSQLGELVDVLSWFSPGSYEAALKLNVLSEKAEGYIGSAEKMTEAQEETNRAMQEAENIEYALNALSSEMTATEVAATEATINMLDAKEMEPEVYKSAVDAITALNEAHYAEAGVVEESMAAVQQDLTEMEDLYWEMYESAEKSITQQFGLFNQMPEVVTAAEYATIEAMNEGNEEFNKSAYAIGQSVGDMISTLNEQANYLDEYLENMDWAIEHHVDEGLLRQLSDGSVESAAILKSIREDGGENIDGLNEALARVKDGKDRFADEVGELYSHFNATKEQMESEYAELSEKLNKYDEAYKSGVQTIQGAINGAGAMGEGLREKFKQLADEAIGAWRAEMAQASPSKVFREMGSNDIMGAILGAESQRRTLRQTYGDLAASAYDAYESNMQDISVEAPTINGGNWRTTAGTLAAQIPRSDVRERPQTVNLVLDEQIIGRVLLPLLQGESERVGVRIGGVA